MAQPPAPSRPAYNSKAHFRRRLGLYLFGVAIGFLILGAIQMMKQSQQAPKAQPHSQTQPESQPAPTITTRLAPEPADTP